MPKVIRPSSAFLRLVLTCCVALTAILMVTPEANAQDSRKAKQFLEDFNHYVQIDNLDLAEANGRALLDMGLTPDQFLAIVEDSATLESRFDAAYTRALRFPQLEDVAADLFELYNDGRKMRAYSVQEIERNLELLGGDARQKYAARSRLLEAKEYAVPTLLQAALKDPRIDVRAEAAQLLIDLGRNAAVPLSVALPHLPEDQQERVARILGQIPHSVSLPVLYELWADATVSSTRQAAEQAIVRIDNTFDPEVRLNNVFRAHAERYYNDRKSGQLLAFPGEEYQLLWEWNPGLGLYPQPVPTALYHEAVVMRSAGEALQHDENDAEATALWLAANISRQLDQDPGYDNPVYPNTRPDASFYAAALGHSISQRVLDRALRDKDVPIARETIAALRSTAGSASLWEGLGERRPLLDALAYPDRRVRYDAALALAEADPRTGFDGAERVVPTLAGMITQAGKRYALIIASSPVQQQDLRDALSAAGYDVLPPIASTGDVQIALADAPGVDLVIADLPGTSLLDAREYVRASSVLGAAPMIGLADGNTLQLIRSEGDPLTMGLRRGISGTELANAAEALVNETVGAPLDEQDALIYAGFALASLRDLAVSRNQVLDASDATLTLLETVSNTEGFVRRQIAEVLSYIDRSEAQQALAEAAADAFEANEQANMLDALAGSARRFGNLLDESHERNIADLATSGEERVRQSAANAAGALGLPGSLIAPIIRGDN